MGLLWIFVGRQQMAEGQPASRGGPAAAAAPAALFYPPVKVGFKNHTAIKHAAITSYF